MEPNNENLTTLLEALLFLYGDEGVKIDELTQILIDFKPSEIAKNLTLLINNYQTNPNSGLMIQQFNQNHYRLCVKPSLMSKLGQLNSGSPEVHLSSTMIEVATIIAYKGPMTRGELEQFRGIDSSFILNKLRDLNLVSSQGYKIDTRAHLYGVTAQFFKVFNLEQGFDSLIPIKTNDFETQVQSVTNEEIETLDHHESNY